jgi:serine/threonine protein kinase
LSEKFGKYRILRKLGEGGMGAVYLAQDPNLNRLIAIKVPRFHDRAYLKRLKKEALAAAALRHANICPIYECAQIDNIPYLSMPFIEGKELSEFITPSQPLPKRQIALLVRKLAKAMHCAHAKGIIHRDLKPSNIMIDQHKEPVIMDFGLARMSDRQGTRLSLPGSVLGTPAYMSPEQASAEENITHRTDIYSLGVVLYELLTGKLPFKGTPCEVLRKITTQEPVPPSRHRPGLDSRLEAICLRAMAMKPADRFPTMKELAGALESYLRETPKTVRPSATGPGRKDPKLGSGGAHPLSHSTGIKSNARRTLVGAGVSLVLLAGLIIGLLAVTKDKHLRTSAPDSTLPPKDALERPLHASGKPPGDGNTGTCARTPNAAPLQNMYGGIAIGGKGIKAIALSLVRDQQGYHLRDLRILKPVNVTLAAGVHKTRKYADDLIKETADEIAQIKDRLQTEFRVPQAHIYLVGSSGLPKAENQEALARAVEGRTGLSLHFNAVQEEGPDAIAGAIPERYRSTSVFIHIGSSTRCGYYDGTRYSIVRREVPGTLFLTELVNEEVKARKCSFVAAASKLGQAKITEPLTAEVEVRPGLRGRDRIYMSGGIVWAMVTLLRPEACEESYVPLTTGDFEEFHRRLANSPDHMPTPRCPRVTDRRIRAIAEAEGRYLKDTFNWENLLAGSEILRSVSTAFYLGSAGKEIYFAREGYIAGLRSYVERKAAQQATP